MVGFEQKSMLSSLGSGHLKVNFKVLNLKVYLQSLRDLDLELVAIIAGFELKHYAALRSYSMYLALNFRLEVSTLLYTAFCSKNSLIKD